MGTMEMDNTQNGQKCCNKHSPLKSAVHKGYNFPCSTLITQIVCCRARGRPRRISTPIACPMPLVLCFLSPCAATPLQRADCSVELRPLDIAEVCQGLCERRSS